MKGIRILAYLLAITLFIGCKKKEVEKKVKIKEASFEFFITFQDIPNFSPKRFYLGGPFIEATYDYDLTLPENDIKYKNQGPQIVTTEPGFVIYNGSEKEFMKVYQRDVEDGYARLYLSNTNEPIVKKQYSTFASSNTSNDRTNVIGQFRLDANSVVLWANLIQRKDDYTKINIQDIVTEGSYTYYSGTFEAKFSYTFSQIISSNNALVTGSFKNLRIQGKKGDRDFY